MNSNTGRLLNCTSQNEDCLQIEAMTNILYGVHTYGTSFGTLMRNFVGLSNFTSFSLTKDVYHAYSDAKKSGFDKMCKAFKPKEKAMHEYFTKLSAALGFQQSEFGSLFDVPSMVGIIDDLYYPLIQQSFYYSRCEDNINLTLNDMTYCANKWDSSMKEIKLSEGEPFNN